MTSRPPSRRLSDQLAAAAADYQAAVVIPHCPQCSNSCCRLDPLVLELEWKQVRTLWRIDEARAAFDRRLAAGQGPQEIRAGNGLYYAHGKPCPAFDEAAANCRVYGQTVKPAGCSDFPVYEDGGVIVADLRCEAVDRVGLGVALGRAIGPDYRIVADADPDFPFLVSLEARRKRPAKR